MGYLGLFQNCFVYVICNTKLSFKQSNIHIIYIKGNTKLGFDYSIQNMNLFWDFFVIGNIPHIFLQYIFFYWR